MDKSASSLGVQTLNALTFKLSVTQILTQVANDEFFFKFNDEIILRILNDTFTDKDSIHEAKYDTEEDASDKVANFLEFGTESQKQEKALEISKTIVETTALVTEKAEMLTKLGELDDRLKTQQLTVVTDEDDVIKSTDSAPPSPTGDNEFSAVSTLDFQVNRAKTSQQAVSTLDFQVNRAKTLPVSMAASRMSLKSDLRSSLSASLGSSLGQLVHEGEITTKEAVEVLSSSLPDMDGGPMTGTTLAEETTPTRKTQKKQTRRVWSAPEFTSTKPQPKHDWIGTLRSHPKRKKLGRKTSKLKLQKLIKSKMLGFKFVSHVTEQAELHKKKEEKRQQDANVVKTWLANKTKKKGTKKKPLFDLRSYSAKTGETNVHTLKLGGMRHPYDLQGVQFVPAERLGAWRKEEGREKWSSSFHTAKFPLPPNRAQTHKLKNEATPRRAIQPKLITFGGYGEVEWFTCLKATDAHYQLHAENMTRLQMARRLLDAQRKKKR